MLRFKQFVCCPEGRLGNSAGDSEQFSRRTARAERIVRRFRLKSIEVDSVELDHAEQFPHRDNGIDIGIVISAEFDSGCFKFFCCARHRGNAVNLGGGNARLLRKKGLDDRPQHPLRTLATGEIRQKFRIKLVHKFHPGR